MKPRRSSVLLVPAASTAAACCGMDAFGSIGAAAGTGLVGLLAGASVG